MKILCIIPPYIPSYFNAGHHLPIFQVGSYLRKNLPNDEITCWDCAALNTTWKEVCDLLIKNFNVIVVLNDFDAIDTFERFQYYKSSLSPHSKTITFGRLSKQIPKFFFKFSFDAVHCSGDYEAGVLAYINYLKKISTSCPGVLLSQDSILTPGIVLEPSHWVMPNIKDIPYLAYHYMYKNDLNKFCGIPERQELVVPIARGCPVGCDYCDVPEMQGKIERRLSVEATINYIVDSFKSLPFEYISFYAPTFTLNRKWVKALCVSLMGLEKRYPWKCVTVLKMLDNELIQIMAKSGCVRISLGIESFTNTAAMGLPKIKQDTLDAFIEVANFCKKSNVELNCFIILGLPGDTPADVKNTVNICLKYGARVRPTIYTPYHKLTEHMELYNTNKFNRQIFCSNTVSDDFARDYYHIFYCNDNDKSTTIMNKIAASIKEVSNSR